MKSYEPLLSEFMAMKRSVTDWGTLALMLRFLACDRLYNGGIALQVGSAKGADAVRHEMVDVGRELVELIAGAGGGKVVPAPSDNWEKLERRVAKLEEFVRAVAGFESVGANE